MSSRHQIAAAFKMSRGRVLFTKSPPLKANRFVDNKSLRKYALLSLWNLAFSYQSFELLLDFCPIYQRVLGVSLELSSVGKNERHFGGFLSLKLVIMLDLLIDGSLKQWAKT